MSCSVAAMQGRLNRLVASGHLSTTYHRSIFSLTQLGKEALASSGKEAG